MVRSLGFCLCMSFVEKATFPPLNCFCTFVKNQLGASTGRPAEGAPLLLRWWCLLSTEEGLVPRALVERLIPDTSVRRGGQPWDQQPGVTAPGRLPGSGEWRPRNEAAAIGVVPLTAANVSRAPCCLVPPWGQVYNHQDILEIIHQIWYQEKNNNNCCNQK